MKILNEKSGEDISSAFLHLMEGKITNAEFEELTRLEPSENNPSRKAWEKRNKAKKNISTL